MTKNRGPEFRQGDWVESVNALGKGLGDDGRSMISLDPNVVMAAAVENTGLSDFGDDDWFVEPLYALCKALEEEAIQLSKFEKLLLSKKPEYLSNFQKFLSRNQLSSHCWITAKRPKD